MSSTNFDPKKILTLCKCLCRRVLFHDLETISRTVISRAYYSAFLHAREYLKEKENIAFTATSTDHLIVETEVKDKVDRRMGSVVRTLREDRNSADYNLSSPSIVTTQGGAWRVLHFNQNAQQESVRLAEFVTSNLAR